MIDSLRFFCGCRFDFFYSFSSIDTSAQDWTRFRGPNGNGVVEGINFPTEWSEDDYAWQTELPGQGHSSVVTHGGRGFLMSGDPQTAIRHVVAIDLNSGKLWQRNYESKTHRFIAGTVLAVVHPQWMQMACMSLGHPPMKPPSKH